MDIVVHITKLCKDSFLVVIVPYRAIVEFASQYYNSWKVKISSAIYNREKTSELIDVAESRGIMVKINQ